MIPLKINSFNHMKHVCTIVHVSKQRQFTNKIMDDRADDKKMGVPGKKIGMEK